ncbi:MAG: hypothetical protein R2824_03835 [Saprospiraceae bacterium]
MKKHYLLLFVLFAFGAVLNAQTRATLTNFKSPSQVANFEIQNIVKFDPTTNIGTIDLRRIQQGRNHLATDTRNGRKLMMLAERRGTKVRVVGFMIQEKDGRYFKLPDTNAHEGKPGDSFGCPDGWDAKIICYTHPSYNVQICYTRCTPTEITLQFPSGL